MNTFVTREAAKTGVKKFIGILSTCIYPDKLSDEQYPMTEDMLHLGPPTPTNFGYGYSKRLLGVQIDTYRKKYNLQYSYITPCNLYSEYDNFHNDGKAHFVTALLQKIKTAVDTGTKELNLFTRLSKPSTSPSSIYSLPSSEKSISASTRTLI